MALEQEKQETKLDGLCPKAKIKKLRKAKTMQQKTTHCPLEQILKAPEVPLQPRFLLVGS